MGGRGNILGWDGEVNKATGFRFWPRLVAKNFGKMQL
jgi:hypothetical protein